MGGRGASYNKVQQAETRVRKAIKSYEKRISEHQSYIADPKIKYKDAWDTFDEARKKRELKHWQTEIQAFRKNIEKEKEKLRRVKDENKN